MSRKETALIRTLMGKAGIGSLHLEEVEQKPSNTSNRKETALIRTLMGKQAQAVCILNRELSTERNCTDQTILNRSDHAEKKKHEAKVATLVGVRTPMESSILKCTETPDDRKQHQWYPKHTECVTYAKLYQWKKKHLP